MPHLVQDGCTGSVPAGGGAIVGTVVAANNIPLGYAVLVRGGALSMVRERHGQAAAALCPSVSASAE